jgi:hypothetical protein
VLPSACDALRARLTQSLRDIRTGYMLAELVVNADAGECSKPNTYL